MCAGGTESQMRRLQRTSGGVRCGDKETGGIMEIQIG